MPRKYYLSIQELLTNVDWLTRALATKDTISPAGDDFTYEESVDQGTDETSMLCICYTSQGERVFEFTVHDVGRLAGMKDQGTARTKVLQDYQSQSNDNRTLPDVEFSGEGNQELFLKFTIPDPPQIVIYSDGDGRGQSPTLPRTTDPSLLSVEYVPGERQKKYGEDGEGSGSSSGGAGRPIPGTEKKKEGKKVVGSVQARRRKKSRRDRVEER